MLFMFLHNLYAINKSCDLSSICELLDIRSSASSLAAKKLTTFISFFSRCPQNIGQQRRWLFHCQNKTNKVVIYGNILIFCSHC